MPKGQSAKLKGAMCNVPIDVISTSNTLPCPANNGQVIVKLKRKLEYRGRYIATFDFVHSTSCMRYTNNVTT